MDLISRGSLQDTAWGGVTVRRVVMGEEKGQKEEEMKKNEKTTEMIVPSLPVHHFNNTSS